MAHKSVMTHQFSQVPQAQIPRASLDRSHGYKTTFDAGYLVPFFIDEVLPGDTFNLKASLFARFATPIVPLMDNMFMDTFFFFVPNRLIWSNFQKFMGEQENPGDSIDYLVPQVEAPEGGWQSGSLSDYFGIPTLVDNIKVDSFWHRAYNLIWNEWFRDENLQESVPVPKGDGPDDPNDFKLLRRGKRHDYFTSCLPWPQKGPGVEIPLGTTADLNANGPMEFTRGSSLVSSGKVIGVNNSVTGNVSYLPYMDGSVYPLTYESGLEVDLSSATAVTINSLRQAFQIQKLYEALGRSGSRYIEIIRGVFGIVSPDARLQRPEYLGGSSTRILINPVAQTSSTDNVSPQGNLSAFGVVSDQIHGFTKSFVEHGVVIGLVNVRADLTYQQGLDRMFSRRTREDFYWPQFAHLGEQAVLNEEIYAQGTSQDKEVFGYQERFAEYRYKPSKITGKFRSKDPQSLDAWHLSQDFDILPALNASFIEDDPPIDRVIAVPSEPHFLFDAYFKYNCVRPMPVYSVPGLVDHF